MRPVSTILVPTGKLCVSKFYKQKKKKQIVDNTVALFFISHRTLRDDRELHIHPNSVLYAEKPPKW